MHIDITRENGRLRLENIACGCSYDHAIPDMDIYIKPGIKSECAEYITQNGLGKNALIVADSNTYGIAAKEICAHLRDSGFSCRLCVLRGEHIEPTQQMTDLIVKNVDDQTEFLLSVGSGVITDLTRRSAFLSDLPFAVFGTAASMDGYTSITSSMMIDGMKVSKYGKSATLLMFDSAVLASAPLDMQGAGVGDLLAKYNVLVDWKLGCAAAGEEFCPLCAHLLEMALDLCMRNIEEISKRSEKGMEALIEALILAGLTVLIVGYTRPVASVEHNMAHYWEMMKLSCGGQAPSHGISVGIGLIYSLLFHDVLANAELRHIDKEKIKAARMTKAQKKAFLISHYPPGVDEEIIAANKYWYLEWEEQERRIDALIEYHTQYKQDYAFLPRYQEIRRILALFDVPTSATKAGIPMDRLEKTLICTKDYRPRYSISAALSELGLLEEAVDNILEIEERL